MRPDEDGPRRGAVPRDDDATSTGARRSTIEAPPDDKVIDPARRLIVVRAAAPAGGQRPRMLPRMPFMLVGTGPLGSGMVGRLASSALSRLRMSVISAGLTWRPSLCTWRTSLGSGTSPSPLPHDDLVDRASRRRPARACGARWPSASQPVGVALADQDDAGRPDDAVHDVLLLGEARRPGRSSSRARSIRSAAAARPGWPSIWAYAACLGAAAEDDQGASSAEQQRADDRGDQVQGAGAGQQPEQREADGGTEDERAEEPPRQLRVGASSPSGRSRRTAGAGSSSAPVDGSWPSLVFPVGA